MTEQATNLSEEDIFAAASATEVEDISTEQPEAAAQPQEPEEPSVPTEQPAAVPETTQEHRVPVKELQEERRKRQEADRRAEEMAERLARLEGFVQASQPRAQPQQPQAAPDIFDDPNGFLQHATQPLEQAIQAQNERFSRMIATRDHGEEKVQAAFDEMAKALKSDPTARYDYQRIMAEEHPYDALVKWHGRKQALAEFGEDPSAYRERLKAELLAELQAQTGAAASAAAATTPNPASIPSLTRATGSAGATEGMITEQDIFNAAPSFKSRRA